MRLHAHRRPGPDIALFLAGYGTFRFIGEFFREPDSQFIGWFSMGKALSLPIWAAAAFFFWYALSQARQSDAVTLLKAEDSPPDRDARPDLGGAVHDHGLLDPEHGYYATRDPLGAGGDFITAPEISQMFGEMIGLWLVQAWDDPGLPEQFPPGRAWTRTRHPDGGHSARREESRRLSAKLEMVLIEASPALARRCSGGQLERRTACDGVEAQFDDAPDDRPLLLVANEFFDALPVRQYVRPSAAGASAWSRREGDDLGLRAGAEAPRRFLCRPCRERARWRGLSKPRRSMPRSREDIARDCARRAAPR